MHTMINAMEDVPCLVKFSNTATHDHTFLKELDLKKGSFVVFDKGYVDYGQYQQWTPGRYLLCDQRKGQCALHEHRRVQYSRPRGRCHPKGRKITLIDKNDKEFQLRRIAFWHDEKRKVYEFITNNYELEADKVVNIYKNRWQIETKG